MCALLRLLLLVLLQVLIHSSSVSGECFIKGDTKCTRNNRDFSVKFSLETNDDFWNYHCDQSFNSDVLDTTKQEASKYHLTPKGSGEGCDNFRYEFHGKNLTLSLNDKNGRDTTLAADVVDDVTWKVKWQYVYIGMVKMANFNVLEFRFGEKTQLLTPMRIILKRKNGYQICKFMITPHKILTISVPRLQKATGKNWVLVIGKDLPKNLRISFIKSKQKRQIHFVKNYDRMDTWVDKIANSLCLHKVFKGRLRIDLR
ncbi:unnamed protein product [Albugo candida]|uniref:PH domain-containing protein n=2 Tax=Albugo candida TaxID=65357 RepID=A0A024FY07_9STRA|nr:unnamed protein product [Albugo candida]|eukprot:CCI11529.1 unnamed protein product [Albugo candida]